MTDTPRYLARTTGYTTNPRLALRAEPEALNAGALEDISARTNRRHRDEQLRDWKARRTRIETELNGLYEQRLTRDVTSQLRALQRTLDQIDVRLHT